MTNQKPNYRLYYEGKHKDYSVKGQHSFCAIDDEQAIKEAIILFTDLISKDNHITYTLTKLEKIAYVIKEVEKLTQIPLN